MSREYTYSELMQMQDKAIERVRQMQERARLTMESDPIEQPVTEEAVKTEEVKEEPPAEEVKAERVSSSPQNQKRQQPGAFPFGLNLNMDKDKATILPLLLLLMNEGADSLLLLALVYIMA